MAAAKVVSTTIVQRNLPYLKQQFGAVLQNSSFVVKFICGTVIFFYFLSFNASTVRIISVTPGFIIPPNFWVWTAFTHCFLETRMWLLFADLVTVGLCGKLLEPLWGTIEMITFFALVNTSVAFLSVMFYIVVFTVTSDPRYLFSVHINGLAGYCAGVAVAVKQIMPDHVLLSTPVGKLKNRNVPLCVLILSLILWPLGLVTGTYPVMFSTGLLSSWIYLRFYQHHSNGTIGDMADSFTFSSFFPNVVQAPLVIVSNTIFEFLVQMKICKKHGKKCSTNPAVSSVTLSLPGTDPHDAERRRQIALRALSERLSKVEQTSWPSVVDDHELLTSEKSKHVTIAIPPATAHHSNSSIAATDSSKTQQSEETLSLLSTFPQVQS